MKNFGFGLMRLPMIGDQHHGDVDIEQTKKMVDQFMAAGFTYFDTAHGYIDGKSEKAVKEALSSRYPRDSYSLTDKLTDDYFKTEADIRPLFESQLEICGVQYFDYYLMHCQMASNYEHFQSCHAYEIAQQLKAEGKIHHVGISFHDTPEMLDRILTDHPEIEVVQIQFNYIDHDSPAVQSGGVYEVCVKHHKPVIVMEPCKGGYLVNLPEAAQKIYDQLNNGSNASYAIRFAASQPAVFMVLSGMSTLGQMEDNISFMKDFKPLSATEAEAVSKVTSILQQQKEIPCTGCRYCTVNCPQQIQIPDLLACYNANMRCKDWNNHMYYDVHTRDHGKASSCLHCGLCEQACPQHLPIRDLLEKVAAEFEKPRQ